MLEIKILEQDESTNAQFNGRLVMTSGFNNTFPGVAPLLALEAVNKIITERVHSTLGADFLQVLIYDNKKFWVIDDGSVVTCLMPEDY